MFDFAEEKKFTSIISAMPDQDTSDTDTDDDDSSSTEK